MDTSETYVKMCEKAKEIQELKPEQFELASDIQFITANFYIVDQLQEMIGCHGIKSLMAVLYILGENLDYYEELSMEQLWLAFVMKERFGKIWSTERGDWVKCE